MTRLLDERVMQIWCRTYHGQLPKSPLIVDRLLRNFPLPSWIRICRSSAIGGRCSEHPCDHEARPGSFGTRGQCASYC
jgi:hypothetical protein